MTRALSTDDGATLSAYPKIRLRLGMRATGTVAQRLGVNPPEKSAVIDLEPAEVSKAMQALGWGRVDKGQARLALASLSALIETMLENAAWACGYEKGADCQVKESFDSVDTRWEEALDGSRAWRAGAFASGAWLDASMGLSSSRPADAPALTGSEWLSMHDHGSQALLATVVDQFARLGARAVVGWTSGFDDMLHARSRLPPTWDWPRLGAALCIEMEDDAAVCASFSRKGIKAMEQSAVGQALGPRSCLAMLASAKPMRLVCGPMRAIRSYSYAALDGMKGSHFPCQTIRANEAWRGEPGATSQEAMDAARAVAGPKGLERLDWVAPSAEPSGKMRLEGVQQWLDSCEAGIQAKKLSRSLARTGAAKPKAGSKPRL